MQGMLFGEASDTAADWRPIHYLGSKLRLTDAIVDEVSDLSVSGRVADLFAGSGTVSASLSRTRDVIASDIQEYSRVLCSAILAPALDGVDEDFERSLLTSTQRKFEELFPLVEPLILLEEDALFQSRDAKRICQIVETEPLIVGHSACADEGLQRARKQVIAQIDRVEGSSRLLATLYFGGVYFSYRQTVWLDAIADALSHCREWEKTVGMAALLSSASAIVNTVGKQFAQPIRPRNKTGDIKLHLLEKIRRDRNLDAENNFATWLPKYLMHQRRGKHRVVRGDFRDVLRNHCSDVSVVYADPPYTRDHYSRFYHVLETLCLRDSPTIKTRLANGTGAMSRGVYREDRHQSPFCIKSQAPDAFDSMFSLVRDLSVPLLLSYSPYEKNGHPRLMTVDAIVEIAKNYFSNVEVKFLDDIVHSKLNKSSLAMKASKEAEVMIRCLI